MPGSGSGNHPHRLTFVALPDEGARALSVLGGGGDVALSSLSPSVLQAAASTGRAHVVAAPGIGWVYAGLNLRRPPLDDARVRRALLLAIDRQAIIDGLLGGRARVANGMFAPGHWLHGTEAPNPSGDVAYDPAEARRLLDAAGLKPDPVTGVRLRLEVKVSTNRLRRAVARSLADGMRPVGIDLVVRPFEVATFLADVRAGRFEAFLLQLPEPVEPDQLAWMFHSQNAAVKLADPTSSSRYARLARLGLPPAVWSAEVAAVPGCTVWQRATLREALEGFTLAPLGLGAATGSANRTAYADAVVDCLADTGRTTLDRGQRAGLYRQLQAQVAQDLPVLPLWWEHQTALVRSGVTLPHLAQDGRYATLGEARWTVP